MAISLKDLKRVKGDGPPRILIYGLQGHYKTTLASQFPNTVFLQTEDGTPADCEVTTFGELDSFGSLMGAIEQLYGQPHDFQYVALDSLSKLQPYVWAETCARGDEKGNVKNYIEDFGFGRGYVYALRVWQEVIEGLFALRRDRGMGIVLIAHAKVSRFDDPETVSYDRYEIDLFESKQVKTTSMFEREMDAILLLKKPVSIKTEEKGLNSKRNIGQGAADRVEILTVGKPAYVAKNRYGMPERIPFERGKGYAALAPYLPGAGEQQDAA